MKEAVDGDLKGNISHGGIGPKTIGIVAKQSIQKKFIGFVRIPKNFKITNTCIHCSILTMKSW